MTNEDLLAYTQSILAARSATSNSYTWDPEQSHAAGRYARRRVLNNGEADVAMIMFDTYANSEVNKTAYLWTLAGNQVVTNEA